MGCLLGKAQEHNTELSMTHLYDQSPGKRDLKCNMPKGNDLSLSYMSELEERIRVVELSNKINAKTNMKQTKKEIKNKMRRTDKMRRKSDVLNRNKGS